MSRRRRQAEGKLSFVQTEGTVVGSGWSRARVGHAEKTHAQKVRKRKTKRRREYIKKQFKNKYVMGIL
jgi:hypothetical protein